MHLICSKLHLNLISYAFAFSFRSIDHASDLYLALNLLNVFFYLSFDIIFSWTLAMISFSSPLFENWLSIISKIHLGPNWLCFKQKHTNAQAHVANNYKTIFMGIQIAVYLTQISMCYPHFSVSKTQISEQDTQFSG